MILSFSAKLISRDRASRLLRPTSHPFFVISAEVLHISVEFFELFFVGDSIPFLLRQKFEPFDLGVLQCFQPTIQLFRNIGGPSYQI